MIADAVAPTTLAGAFVLGAISGSVATLAMFRVVLAVVRKATRDRSARR